MRTAAVNDHGIEAVETACQEARDQNVSLSAVILDILARRRHPAGGDSALRVTGQNPASSELTAQLPKAIRESAAS